MTPESIGGYEILSELGRGGMGVVYQGQDKAIGRLVAIKVIRVDQGTTAEDSAQLRQRLIREASVAGKIYHPGIVTVHQLGEDGENVFVVMEFVEGSSLEKLLSHNSALDRGWALDILTQVALALDYAHKVGVVHRDVKPANILVRSDGRVKIADFGIAKMIAETAMLTGTGVSIGSPAYMSPEQIQGAPVDGRSDQFSLAIIAFQMLAGRMPFPGTTAHTLMYQIVNADPFQKQPVQPQPGDRPFTPRERTVLARALAKKPEDRYTDCATFLQELTGAANLAPPVFETATAVIAMPAKVPPPPKWWTRPPLIGACAAAALLVVLIFSWYIHRTCCSPPPVAPSADNALIKAIVNGKTDDVNKLLSAQTANQANPDGVTPLLAAIRYGKPAIVKALLAKGANVDAPDHDGTTPLMLASEGTGYLPDNLPLVTALIGHNPNLEAQDSSGRTALHRAVTQGKIDVVRLLLDHGAQIDSKTNDGSTPLFYAVQFGKVPILQLLIERHAAVDQPNASGDTPLMIASQGNGYLPNNGPMVEALLAAGAHVDTADAQGRSALYRAAAQGKEDAMRLLLDHQANVNLRASDGTTPLFATVTNGRLGAAQLLIEHNADEKLSNADDITPLMVAAETSPYIKNPADFIKLLLDHGAKKTTTDARGRTALQHAIDSKNQVAIDLLK